MSILRDYYDTGGNWDYEIYGSEWKGQTFTTSSAYTLTSVSLSLARSGTPGTLTVSIFATSGGEPTGSVLTSNTYDGNSLSDSVYTWIDIQLTPYSLSSGVQYAIVVKATSGDSSNFVYWLAESGMPSYAGGSQVWSSNSGSSWTTQGNNDQYFRTYGVQNITFGEYLGAGSGTTKLLLHLNGSSTDSSGNGNNGTDTNVTYSLANGKFGQGASFNGSSSSIVKKDTASLKITTNITISAWINPSSAPTSSCVAGKFLDSTHKSYWLAFNGGKAGMYISTNGSNQTGEALSQTLSNGVWYNVIGTYDGTNTKIYVNGSLANSIGQTGGIYDSTGSFAVGKLGSLSSNYFPGKIDEVIVENRAWTASEIKKYYTYSKGRFGIL